MPTISRFHGIVVRMYFNDHNPPHFHAVYNRDEVLIEIAGQQVHRGKLPRRLVQQWAAQHVPELEVDWNLVQTGQNPNPIDPLP